MSNIAVDPREAEAGAFRTAARDMASRFTPQLLVTLTFNRDTRPETIEKTLTEFLARMDRRLLGPRWSMMASDRRTRHFAVLENPHTNPHIHLLVMPADGKWFEFSTHASRTWKKLVTSGSVDVQPVTNEAGAIDYVTKFLTADRAERMILAPHHV